MLKKTPLESLHKQFNAEFIEYFGYWMPGTFSEPNEELKGLSAGSAAFDLCCFSRISVTGGGAEELLSRAFGESSLPAKDKWSWLNAEKKARIINADEEYTVTVHPKKARETSELLTSLSEQTGAIVTDKTEKTAMVGIYGPTAFDIVKNIVPMDISSLEGADVLELSFFMMSLTVIRGSWLGSDGIELICPTNASRFASQALEKYQRTESVVPAGMVCFDAAFEEYILQTV